MKLAVLTFSELTPCLDIAPTCMEFSKKEDGYSGTMEMLKTFLRLFDEPSSFLGEDAYRFLPSKGFKLN